MDKETMKNINDILVKALKSYRLRTKIILKTIWIIDLLLVIVSSPIYLIRAILLTIGTKITSRELGRNLKEFGKMFDGGDKSNITDMYPQSLPDDTSDNSEPLNKELNTTNVISCSKCGTKIEIINGVFKCPKCSK